MLRSGDWLVPTLDGLPFFHKPPLFYWITAGAMQLFGPGVMAARAAAWLAAVAMATVLFAFVRRWAGLNLAWTTTAVLATLPLSYGAAQYANMDMLVAGCIGITILSAAHAALARARRQPFGRALAAAFVAAALGVLAKGLIGAVLPLLVLAAWGFATQRLGKVLALLMWAPGWLLFCAIAAPWFIGVQQRFADFGHYFFVVQHFQRFAAPGFNNPQPWWFYAAVLLAFTLPWSAWLASALRRRYWARTEHADVRMLMLVWVGVVGVFFSLPSSKLIGYILPAVPPLAFLIADAARLASVGPAVRARRWRTATAALAAITCVGATIVAHFQQPKSQQDLAETLRASKQPGEPVLFLDGYYYDLMFYARLDAPVLVVDPWLASEVAQDSWRRELVDAARFAPAGAARRLLQPAEAVAALCRAPSSWVVGPWPPNPQSAWLAEPPHYRSGGTALWHIVPAASSMGSGLPCAGTAPAGA